MGAATPLLLGMGVVPALAAWTLKDVLGLSMDDAFLLWGALVIAPVLFLGVAAPRGDPYDD